MSKRKLNHEPTDKTRAEVEALASFGAPQAVTPGCERSMLRAVKAFTSEVMEDWD